jgi:hypothetical protein
MRTSTTVDKSRLGVDMFSSAKHLFGSVIPNLSGWRTRRKLVVLESDDWGSVRMPSKRAFDALKAAGVRVGSCPYCRFDSLATVEDLSRLFEILLRFCDARGKPPAITANTIVVNPDFARIRASGFHEYHYEPFTETLKRGSATEGSFPLWKQGLESAIFFPQFHGREHLNVDRWMKALQGDFPETKLAFDQGVYGLSTDISTEKRRSYLAALDFDEPSELARQVTILKDGLDIFERIFGYRSESFIAPNFVWHHGLEPALSAGGVRFIQGEHVQFEPRGNDRPFVHIKHSTGQFNALRQCYLVRNCSFQPSFDPDPRLAERCLDEIGLAFRFRKPALISIHRVNFIGALVPENRERNLELFERLLTKALKQHPEIEFMNTAQLGSLIASERFAA